uniref:Uncharacterized protein n=1 Tax=Amphimedon queenslandica TaxID=400682 RepID=A0A1X7VR85_AMPQE
MATRFQQHHHTLKAGWRISALHLLALYSTTVASAAQPLVLSLHLGNLRF